MLDGIIGWARGKIDYCYNIAEITATGKNSVGSSCVGGITGGSDIDGSSIENCYNIGTISGVGKCIGGIIGTLGWNSINTLNYGINVGDVYHSSTLASVDNGTNTSYLFGKIVGTTNPNNKGSEVTNSISITEEQLKNYTNEELKNKLGEEFVRDESNINNGYPILKWQLEK